MDSGIRPAVLVFARWWADGPVKTRLAEGIGQPAAREVYRALAAQVWHGLESPRLERQLWAAPAEALAEVAAWLGAERACAQPDADLGTRLTAAFAAAFADGVPWAAVVGTDAPAIDARRVLQAGAALDQADAVLIPAEDGGYAALALKAPQPALLQDVPWGTAEVLAVTLTRARDAGLEVRVLDAVRDLDTVEDLLALRAAGLLQP